MQEYERAVIFRLGRNRTGGAKGPGLFFIIPCIDTCVTLDLRTITFDVPPQEVLTKDSVTITVDAVVYYRVFDPVLSVNKGNLFHKFFESNAKQYSFPSFKYLSGQRSIFNSPTSGYEFAQHFRHKNSSRNSY